MRVRRMGDWRMQTPTEPGWLGDEQQRQPPASGPYPAAPGWAAPPQSGLGAPPPGLTGPYGPAPLVAADPYRRGAAPPPLAPGPGGPAVDRLLAATAHASILFGLLG